MPLKSFCRPAKIATVSAAMLLCHWAGAGQATYTLSADFIGSGRISSIGPKFLFCTAAGHPHCFATYDAGTVVTITASSSTTPTFHGWDGACAGTVGRECTIVMDSDKFVSATFGSPVLVGAYDLDLQINGKGSVHLRPDDTDGYNLHTHRTSDKSKKESFRYYPWQAVTLTADPSYNNINHRFVGWGGYCASFGASRSCTVEIKSKTHVEATFAEPAGSGSCYSRGFNFYEKRMQDLFIAYYGRPADVGGLEFWSGELKKKRGDISSIMEVFGRSPEFANRFGSMNNSELVHNLFAQLYGRPADPDGLNFYVNQLNTGQRTLSSIALTILDGTPEGSSDARALANRRAAANHYTTTAEVVRGGAVTIAEFTGVLAPVVSEGDASAACEQISNWFK